MNNFLKYYKSIFKTTVSTMSENPSNPPPKRTGATKVRPPCVVAMNIAQEQEEAPALVRKFIEVLGNSKYCDYLGLGARGYEVLEDFGQSCGFYRNIAKACEELKGDRELFRKLKKFVEEAENSTGDWDRAREYNPYWARY